MRSIRSIAFASWVYEHFSLGGFDEALSGDLLEEFHSGRSAIWYWRQILTTIVSNTYRWGRRFATPFAFSIGWTMLYPIWRFLGKSLGMDGIAGKWAGLTWPYSSIVEIGYGVAPTVAFVWIGLMVYLLLREEGLGRLSGHGLIRGLSLSLTVLLTGSTLLLHHLRHPQVDLACITRSGFYSTFHVYNISVLVAVCLFAALAAVSDTTQGVRILRNSSGAISGNTRGVVRGICLLLLLALPAAAQSNTASAIVRLVPVDPDVKLEVLDWGGTGRPLVFLAGLGNTAHIFEKFAPKFTETYHVYGITRRGFGVSSKPDPTIHNYAADRLGEDVVAVLDALKLDRPVLAGHSLAGEELSSIGSHHPERVAGLIYLEAGYGYAFYDRAHGDTIFDFFQLQRRLDDYMAGTVADPDRFMQDFSANVSRLDMDLQENQRRDPSAPILHAPRGSTPAIIRAINLGATEYSEIHVPILAIFACPHNLDSDPSLRGNPKVKAALIADNLFYTSRQADAFAAGIPSARVVRLPNADHYIFRSNEAEVFREMNAFLASVPHP